MILRLILLVFCFFSYGLCNCPKHSFLCNDGSCIPKEWIDDGESDCDDGSDEKQRRPSNVTLLPTKPNTRSTFNDDAIDQDPFDEAAQATLVNTVAAVSGSQCSLNIQGEVHKCSKQLISWHDDMNNFDSTSISFIKHEIEWLRLQKGCGLFLKYQKCINSLNIEECEIDRAVSMWNYLEIYVCQLILPSVKEYKNCFSVARDPRCTPMPQSSSSIPICRILSSIANDLGCVHQLSTEVCDERSNEILSAIQSETDFLEAHLNCVSDNATARSEDSVCPECSNLLEVFINLDRFCQKTLPNPWRSAHESVCAHRKQLTMHKECYRKAMNESNCKRKIFESDARECEIMDHFITNIDCIIVVMNDVCEIDAQNEVVILQNALSENATAKNCYEKQPEQNKTSGNGNGFSLQPVYPKCTDNQENVALVCLVELVEINQRVTELKSYNFLHEISDANSSIVGHICTLYATYSKCLNESVFSLTNGERCAFNSPLNTLSRIGLSSVCEPNSREILQRNHQCMVRIKDKTDQCQSALDDLPNFVAMMIKGVHGEALLCKIFYDIKHAFECSEKILLEHCAADNVQNIVSLRQELERTATMEGCPSTMPADLDDIIARPVVSQLLNQEHPIKSRSKNICSVFEQKQFSDCIQPLTSFQPHPLSVIRQPKNIDSACKAFESFKTCRYNASCKPLWAHGMTAMFDYACGSGNSLYNSVKQCVRKMTTRDDIRECVGTFSKSAPHLACHSSNALHHCTAIPMKEKCGDGSEVFIKEYIERFASAIDPHCKIGTSIAITGYNCSSQENQLISRCAAPMNDLSSRIDRMFEGGLKDFLNNVKNIGPVFEDGCNLTTDFLRCISPVIQAETQCVASSCLVIAGDGICGHNDTGIAIENHLGCIFQQASNPQFGRCLRTTIAQLKTFNLDSLRTVLPSFVDCIEDFVVDKCGMTPLNVLRAISSKDICPITSTMLLAVDDLSIAEGCNQISQQNHQICIGDLYEKYAYHPIAVLNDVSNIDKLCSRFASIVPCSITSCIKSEAGALNAVVKLMCTKKEEFKKHAHCLTTVVTSEKWSVCLAKSLSITHSQCSTLSSIAECSRPIVKETCGNEALEMSLSAMDVYAKHISQSCNIVSSEFIDSNGCSESDRMDYIRCELHFDRFSVQPISLIRNASDWDEFCASSKLYEACVNNMTCKIEPNSHTNIAVFRMLCNDLEQNAKQHLKCLTRYSNSEEGQKCTSEFASIDLLSEQAPKILCDSFRSILNCSSNQVRQQCGDLALKFVYSAHKLWAEDFNPTCIIETGFKSIVEADPEPEIKPEPEPNSVPEPKPEPTVNEVIVKSMVITEQTTISESDQFLSKLDSETEGGTGMSEYGEYEANDDAHGRSSSEKQFAFHRILLHILLFLLMMRI